MTDISSFIPLMLRLTIYHNREEIGGYKYLTSNISDDDDGLF
jgi:hypothetical protein